MGLGRSMHIDAGRRIQSHSIAFLAARERYSRRSIVDGSALLRFAHPFNCGTVRTSSVGFRLQFSGIAVNALRHSPLSNEMRICRCLELRPSGEWSGQPRHEGEMSKRGLTSHQSAMRPSRRRHCPKKLVDPTLGYRIDIPANRPQWSGSANLPLGRRRFGPPGLSRSLMIGHSYTRAILVGAEGKEARQYLTFTTAFFPAGSLERASPAMGCTPQLPSGLISSIAAGARIRWSRYHNQMAIVSGHTLAMS